MGADRFVYWKEKKPSKEEIQKILEDFIGGAGTLAEWGNGRFGIDLKGENSFPFRRIPDALKHHFPIKERFIEVFVHPHCIDILTRQADEYTHSVAEGMAAMFARFFEGSRDG